MKKLKRLYVTVALTCAVLAASFLTVGCSSREKCDDEPAFVTVRDGRFFVGDSVYRFVGANFWYGAILASEGRGGDRNRLARELDLLQASGIDNLRILVGGDGAENIPAHIMPVLQTAPGVYNDTILDGLDYLMNELEKRDMKAVLYLNNSWEWSGGYGTYLEWAGEGVAPVPAIDGYKTYTDFVSKFVVNDSAKAMAAKHVRNIVERTNRYTGKPYAESPALMSWQIANEPRAFASDSLTKAAFARWIADQAALIKSLDGNHLVSTGSEGYNGCEVDFGLWERIHSDPNIDYGIIHIWPYNWRWVSPDSLTEQVDVAVEKSLEYIAPHAETMSRIGKPLVLEEFGYPRDNMEIGLGTPTNGRDRYYDAVLSLVRDTDLIQGCNFWAWGGHAVPAHRDWQPWDQYTGDPAQEAQGLNSVFASDSSTLKIIRERSAEIGAKR